MRGCHFFNQTMLEGLSKEKSKKTYTHKTSSIETFSDMFRGNTLTCVGKKFRCTSSLAIVTWILTTTRK